MLAFALLLAPPLGPDTSTARTIDLARLTWREAEQLEGKPVRVSFTGVRFRFGGGGDVILEAESADRVRRWVCFPASSPFGGLRTGDRVTVDGCIRTSVVLAGVEGGELLPEVLHLEIVDARRVWP